MPDPIQSVLHILTHLILQSYEVNEETSSEMLNNAEIMARQRNWNLNWSLHLVSLLLTAMLYQNLYAILGKYYAVGIASSFHKLF